MPIGEDYCITEPTYLSINNGSYSLSNEGVRADTFLLNTVITYYCLDGFFKASGNLTRRCLGGIITNIGNFKNTSAVWSGIGPTCDGKFPICSFLRISTSVVVLY